MPSYSFFFLNIWTTHDKSLTQFEPFIQSHPYIYIYSFNSSTLGYNKYLTEITRPHVMSF